MLWRKILHDLLAWLLLSALLVYLLPLPASWAQAALLLLLTGAGLWWSVRLRFLQSKEQPQDVQALKLAQGADRIFSAFAYLVIAALLLFFGSSFYIAWLTSSQGATAGEEALRALLNTLLDSDSPLRLLVNIYTLQPKALALWLTGFFVAFRLAALYFIQSAYKG